MVFILCCYSYCSRTFIPVEAQIPLVLPVVGILPGISIQDLRWFYRIGQLIYADTEAKTIHIFDTETLDDKVLQLGKVWCSIKLCVDNILHKTIILTSI